MRILVTGWLGVLWGIPGPGCSLTHGALALVPLGIACDHVGGFLSGQRPDLMQYDRAHFRFRCLSALFLLALGVAALGVCLSLLLLLACVVT